MYWKGPVASWRNQKQRYKHLGRVGKVESWTRIESPPESFNYQNSYVLGLVDFGGGDKCMGQIVDKQIKIGDRVEGVLRRLYEDGKEGVITYGTKFRKVKGDK